MSNNKFLRLHGARVDATILYGSIQLGYADTTDIHIVCNAEHCGFAPRWGNENILKLHTPYHGRSRDVLRTRAYLAPYLVLIDYAKQGHARRCSYSRSSGIRKFLPVVCATCINNVLALRTERFAARDSSHAACGYVWGINVFCYVRPETRVWT